jgi:hypothetical protein
MPNIFKTKSMPMKKQKEELPAASVRRPLKISEHPSYGLYVSIKGTLKLTLTDNLTINYNLIIN